ncbi:MAG: rhodanese-like domain-containing protein [Truepera sp.]|nr:rhodanese-like domain-containing protein [Truepera sp.]
MIRLSLLILAVLLLAGCGPGNYQGATGDALVGASRETPNYQNVSVHDLAGTGESRLVLDVREPWEFAAGHVPGAILIPLGQLAARVGEFPQDKPLYVICRSGNRSVTASQILVAAGKRDVRNVEGGMIAWQGAGLPVSR